MSQFLEAKQIPIWLDCDPGKGTTFLYSAYACNGAKDAFALLMCAHHPNIEFIGVSTVHGNASLEKTTKNASSILVALGRTDVPVYPGAAKPFSRPALHAPDIHGESGIDGTSLLPPPTPAVGARPGALPAVTAMYTALKAQPAGTPWIVATGALTNVALLLAVHPDIADHIAGISIMGGALGDCHTEVVESSTQGQAPVTAGRVGNITPHAEFNIYCDPEAARSIFTHPRLAPGSVILVPLDVTHTVLATQDVLANVLGGGSGGTSPLRQMMHDLLIFFASTYANVFGIGAGPPLHDPIAVAAVLHRERVHQDLDFTYGGWIPGDISGKPTCGVHVVTAGVHGDGSNLGATIVTDEVTDGQILVPRSLNVPRFWESVYACLAQAEFFSAMGKK